MRCHGARVRCHAARVRRRGARMRCHGAINPAASLPPGASEAPAAGAPGPAFRTCAHRSSSGHRKPEGLQQVGRRLGANLREQQGEALGFAMNSLLLVPVRSRA